MIEKAEGFGLRGTDEVAPDPVECDAVGAARLVPGIDGQPNVWSIQLITDRGNSSCCNIIARIVCDHMTGRRHIVPHQTNLPGNDLCVTKSDGHQYSLSCQVSHQRWQISGQCRPAHVSAGCKSILRGLESMNQRTQPTPICNIIVRQ